MAAYLRETRLVLYTAGYFQDVSGQVSPLVLSLGRQKTYTLPTGYFPLRLLLLIISWHVLHTPRLSLFQTRKPDVKTGLILGLASLTLARRQTQRGCKRASRLLWQSAPRLWGCWWWRCWRCWPRQGREWRAWPFGQGSPQEALGRISTRSSQIDLRTEVTDCCQSRFYPTLVRASCSYLKLCRPESHVTFDFRFYHFFYNCANELTWSDLYIYKFDTTQRGVHAV